MQVAKIVGLTLISKSEISVKLTQKDEKDRKKAYRFAAVIFSEQNHSNSIAIGAIFSMLPQIEASIISNNVAKFEYVKIIHIP